MLRAPTKEQAGPLIALIGMIFGAWVRLTGPLLAGFPINDGGLFAVMIQAIQADGMKLPSYVAYNGRQIPFAYPPLAFYLGAILSNVFHTTAIEILQWLPAVVLVLTIPAFYYLARTVMDSSLQAGMATLIYAFTPRSITWQIMGGGLTRSLGFLFLLLALACVFRLFARGDRRYLIPSIAFCTLVVLTHPEAALDTAAVAILFWIFKGRTRTSAMNALGVAAGTLLLSAVWWLPTLSKIGLEPFLAAGGTGLQAAWSIWIPFMSVFTEEPLITTIAVLGLVGFIFCVRGRRYLLPAWFFLPYLVEPRTAQTLSTPPLALLAGLALSDVLLPVFEQAGRRSDSLSEANPLFYGADAATIAVFGAYLLGGAMLFAVQLSGTTVSPADRTAIHWIASNTPPDSRFLVLTGDPDNFCDSIQEWFPVLSGRVDVSTVQGTEWLPGGAFARAARLQDGLQECVHSASPLSCIDDKHLQYDYVYVQRISSLKTACRTQGTLARGGNVVLALDGATQYQPVYSSDAVRIYRVEP